MKFNFYQRFLLVQLALLRLRQFGANVFRSYIDRTSLLCQFSGCECLSEPKFEWCKMEQWSLSWLISGGSNISLSRPAQEEREINVIVFILRLRRFNIQEWMENVGNTRMLIRTDMQRILVHLKVRLIVEAIVLQCLLREVVSLGTSH